MSSQGMQPSSDFFWMITKAAMAARIEIKIKSIDFMLYAPEKMVAVHPFFSRNDVNPMRTLMIQFFIHCCNNGYGS